MNNTGYYNDLLVIRQRFLSDNEGKPLSSLEAEVSRLKAEQELYKECKRKTKSSRYEVRVAEAGKVLKEKEDRLTLLKQKIEDAKFEIETLEELINLEQSNIGAIIV